MTRASRIQPLTLLPWDMPASIETPHFHCAAPCRLQHHPRVTAVVLTYNRKADVLRTLDHLTTLPERPHVIVVDNGSSDWTADSVTASFPLVEIIRLPWNIGAAARNAGIARSTTPYVALCDDDTWWEAGSLSLACGLLDHCPRLAVVNGAVLVGQRQQLDPASRVMAASPLPRRSDCPGVPILGFLAGASVIRRTAFVEVGGFESRYFIGGEEDLVALDLAARGWTLAFFPHIIVHHYPSAEREKSRRGHLLLRNAVWTSWLRRPLPSAARRTISLLAPSAQEQIQRGMLQDIVCGLPWVLKRRRVVPSEIERSLELLEEHR